MRSQCLIKKAKYYIATLAVTVGGLAIPHASMAQIKTLGFDYAYWSPETIVIKNKGWMEDEFKKDKIEIQWRFSQGSNNSLEFINSGATNFAVTAAISSLMSRANGQPLKAIYNYLWSETSMIMVNHDSTIESMGDLKGQKVAVTKGTNPYFFLLRSLAANNMKTSEVQIVHLQHPDGRVALEQNRVSAWSGLDPHMASAQVSGAKPIYRNPNFRDANFLNTTEQFIEENPDIVTRVLEIFEKARVWIMENNSDAVTMLAQETKLPEDVIRLQLERYDFSEPIPGEKHHTAIKSIIPLLMQEGILKPGADANAALDSLFDSSFISALLGVK